jgi:hypothetical protein
MEFVDKETIRRSLPMAYVCFELGLPLNGEGKRVCPFHDDHDPSFRTWVDEFDVPRWGCFPCSSKGDSLDLIQRMEGVGFTDSLLRAQEMLATMPPEWEGVGQELKRTFDRATAEELVADARERANTSLGSIGVALGVVPQSAPDAYRWHADLFLAGTWRMGFDESWNTVIPHYAYDGTLTGVKFRELGGGERWAMPGSSFDCMYGGWNARLHRDVILCEGESDAWWAALQAPPADVLALPAGAGLFLPQWVDVQADTYFVAFDGDEAGRNAVAVWRSHLAGRTMAVVEPPEGEDLRSWQPPLEHIVQTYDRFVA